MKNITFQALQIKMTNAIEKYIRKRLDGFEKLLHVNSDNVDTLGCHVRIRREMAEHHKKGKDVYHVDATIEHNGQSYRADANRDDLYTAIDEVKDDLSRLITKDLSIKRVAERQSGAKVKRLLRSG